MAMWDWIGYVDPDFMLSVVTKGQWCSWSDTGWDNPEYDALYEKQGTTIDPEERKQIVWEMQQMIYDNFLYTQLVNMSTSRRTRRSGTASRRRSTRTRRSSRRSRTRWDSEGREAERGRDRARLHREAASLFAIVTVFVAITLNFVLFRAIPRRRRVGAPLPALHAAVQGRTCARSSASTSPSGSSTALPRDLAQGDLGKLVRSQQPVRNELWPSIKNTCRWSRSAPLRGHVRHHRGGDLPPGGAAPCDKAGLWTGLGFYSMPPQWLGLMIVLFVAGAFGLPTSGIKDPTLGILDDASTLDLFVDRLRHMVLPALTIGLVLYGEYALIVRSAMLETLGEDYVLTARAKGLSSWCDRLEARLPERACSRS